MESKKYNKLVNIIKNTQTHRYREQTSGYPQGEGRGNMEVGKWEVQTIMYKINYKDILYNTGNTANIL